MTYAQGIAFRATSGYVTDGATDSVELGGVGATYPRTTAQGNVVGWEQPVGNTRDRSTTVDHRLAGIHITSSQQRDFRFDLPASGDYNIVVAAGDMGSNSGTVWSVVDGTTTLGTLTTGTPGASGSFKDATDTARTAANWPSQNVAARFTFSTNICRIRSSSAVATNVIAYVYVETAAGSGVTGTLAASEGADTLAADGAPSISGTLARAEAGDTGFITGSVSVAGAMAVAEGSDSLAASGAVASGPITGTLAKTEVADTLAAIGTSAAPQASGGDGGGAGNVREVRRFADLLDKARKPSRTQRKKRRAELVAEALELLPDLPQAAEIAPVAARIVYEQEAAARATAYANRPIEAMEPVVIPFDAHAALRDLIAKLMADENMRRELEAEENEVDEFLLLGS